MHFSTFWTFILLISVHSVRSCSPQEIAWVNHTAKLVNVESANVDVKHSVAGSVTITSGCSFSVRNLTIIPTGNGAYWWGIPIDNNTDPYPRVVTAALGSFNGQEVTFFLDSKYSFAQISIMEIYSEGDNRPYGAWAISGNVSSHYGVGNAGTTPLDFDNDATANAVDRWLYLIVAMATTMTMVSKVVV